MGRALGVSYAGYNAKAHRHIGLPTLYKLPRAPHFRHWHRSPAFCGNGGFSLRRRAFITTILQTFPWVSQRTSGNEDWYICNRAADIYPLLLARDDPALIAAPREEALAFSVEMLYADRPFGVHQFWSNLQPNMTALRTLFDNCPEALQILPGDIIARRPDWRGILCQLVPMLAGCVSPGTGVEIKAAAGIAAASSSSSSTEAHIQDKLLGRRHRHHQKAMRRKRQGDQGERGTGSA